MSVFSAARLAPALPEDEAVTSEQLLHRARAGTRLMTARGAAMRGISIGANLVLVALVTPRELGLFAVVRGTLLISHMLCDLGIPRALLRRAGSPTGVEYAALAGLHATIAVVIVAVCSFWPSVALGFGALDIRWRWWMMLTLGTALVLPFGTGARVRLQRSLAYERIAIADVTGVLVQNVGLLLFAFARAFSEGVFVAVAAAIVITNGLLYRWSPGPLPKLDVGPLRSLMRQSSGFMVSSWLSSARESGTPVLIGKLFGLQVAGTWAFAVRLGQLLDVTFDGFRNATIPASARLIHDRPALRRLVTATLAGTSALATPIAGVTFVTLPILAVIWPKWRAGIELAQVYLLCYAISGIVVASLEAAVVATRGAVVMLAEHGSALAAAWIGLLIVRSVGLHSLVWVVFLMSAAPALALLFLTDVTVRPEWNRQLTRLAVSLVTGLTLYVVCGHLRAPPVPTAAIASAGILVWLRPVTRLRQMQSVLGRMVRPGPRSRVVAT
ncbi:MAG: oligosaccharide flippase family protein [Gemmatimonadaceae bacterium]